MLSIIIPVKNESENLKDITDYFVNNLNDLEFELLIVNDYSEDDTFDKMKNLSMKNKNLKILNNTKKGLGGAVNLGIKESSGSYISIMMADKSDDINDLKKYYKIITSEKYDAVLGSRFCESQITNYPLEN